jgi:four helix bundle protein
MKDFKQLTIWQKGMEVVIATYKIAAQLPADERYGLKSQMTRAAVSIPSNIAEGSARGSDKAYKQFLQYSLGSAFELETQLRVVQELAMANHTEVETLLELVKVEQMQVTSLMKRLQ